jgi:hypothetical protein
MTEVLDLDLVAHVRRHGTLGLIQVLKSFRDGPRAFPGLRSGPAAGPGFAGLGELRLQNSVRDSD